MSNLTGRHVILEGPDGSGKTTLREMLSKELGIPMAHKVSDSKRGVEGVDLARYVDQDMDTWVNYRSSDPQVNRSAYSALTHYRGSEIYDRYPLISEPIYGLHVRHEHKPAFLAPWYGMKWREFLAHDPLVIFCLPPYDEVAKHVTPNRDMPGVWKNIVRIYKAYEIEALKYPGTSVRYDYTVHSQDGILSRAAEHIGL